MNYLRYNTASQEYVIGPFLDSTDGVTPETGLTIANTDIRLFKEGASVFANKNSGGGTHLEDGYYLATFDATDTGTLGKLIGQINISGALPVRIEFTVLPANTYDSWILGTDYQVVDLLQIGGDTQSATDLKDFADAGYDPATNKVQGVVLTDTTTTNTDMVGTNSAALASVCTEGRLAELDAGNLPTDISNLNDFDPAGDVVARVTLTDTTTTNTDMRGTNSAALASVCTEPRLAELDAGNLPTDISNLNDFDPTSDTVARVTLTDTTTTNTDMRGTDSANTVIPPTEAQMNARTILSAAYFDPAVDVVARVTLTDTTTDLTTKTGFSLSAAGVDAIIDEVLTDLSNTDIDAGQSITVRKALRAVFNRFFRAVTQTATLQTVKNDLDAAIADMSVSDDGTTQTKATT